MLSIDILISFAFMALLFLRHVAILKRPNKINYAPLMLGIGGIATLIHFIVYSHATEITPLLKESLFPFLVALMFYIVMNILNQTKESDEAKQREEFSALLVRELSQLKSFMLELENRMLEFSKENMARQESLREEFKKDVESLELVLENQKVFTKRFEELELWHKDVHRAFEEFSTKQLPELDAMVHKHIDVLRVAEQEHYNKLNELLEKAMQGRGDLQKEIANLQSEMQKVQSISETIASSIVKSTKQQFGHITEELAGELVSLKLHAEGIKTTLYEDENILTNVRSESEMVLKQMVLSSNQMQEVQKYVTSIQTLLSTLQSLSSELEVMKLDYIKAQAELSSMLQNFSSSEEDKREIVVKQIAKMLKNLDENLDEKLEMLQKYYQNTSDHIHEQAQFLAKRAQLFKGYSDLEDA
jgi:hypothetical protein